MSKKAFIEKVQSEDLLTEILILLPPIAIFRFMLVSKTWRNIIKRPSFQKRYSAVVCSPSSRGHRTAIHSESLPMAAISSKKSLKKTPCVYNSSNGLILCSDSLFIGWVKNDTPEGVLMYTPRPIYHVVNPVTGKSAALPPPPNRKHVTSIGIMCLENTAELAAKYIVVRAATPTLGWDVSNTLHIETYSSTTGAWATSTLIATEDISLRQHLSPMVARGVLHWYLTGWRIAVYDPSDSGNHLQLIKVPNFGSDLNVDSYKITRLEDDLLWVGIVKDDRFRILMLPKGENGYRRNTSINEEEWELIYDIVDPQWNNMRLEAFLPWEDKLVAVMMEKEKEEMFFYNVEKRRMKKIEYEGNGTYSYRKDFFLTPYMEPSFLSSYAL